MVERLFLFLHQAMLNYMDYSVISPYILMIGTILIIFLYLFYLFFSSIPPQNPSVFEPIDTLSIIELSHEFN